MDVGSRFPLANDPNSCFYSLGLRVRLFRMEIKVKFFIQWVVILWNSIPPEAVEAQLMILFKTCIHGFLANKGIKGSGNCAGNRN